jgi:hypothetical protein
MIGEINKYSFLKIIILETKMVDYKTKMWIAYEMDKWFSQIEPNYNPAVEEYGLLPEFCAQQQQPQPPPPSYESLYHIHTASPPRYNEVAFI